MTDDDRLFLALFREHRPQMLRVIRRVLRHADPQGVEDVAQATFIKARRSFQPELSGAFRYWILTAAKRNAINRLRQEANDRRHGIENEGAAPPGSWAVPEGFDPETLTLRKELCALVEEAVVKLPGIHPEIFRLWIFEEMDNRAIAAALKIPRGTVMSALHRSKPKVYAHLRERLALPASLAVA